VFRVIERSGLDVEEETSSPHSRLAYIHRFLLRDLVSAIVPVFMTNTAVAIGW
jgi:hypothetical protein